SYKEQTIGLEVQAASTYEPLAEQGLDHADRGLTPLRILVGANYAFGLIERQIHVCFCYAKPLAVEQHLVGFANAGPGFGYNYPVDFNSAGFNEIDCFTATGDSRPAQIHL